MHSQSDPQGSKFDPRGSQSDSQGSSLTFKTNPVMSTAASKLPGVSAPCTSIHLHTYMFTCDADYKITFVQT